MPTFSQATLTGPHDAAHAGFARVDLDNPPERLLWRSGGWLPQRPTAGDPQEAVPTDVVHCTASWQGGHGASGA
jgi:hypothetical protein